MSALVLLIEDNQQILNGNARMLRRRGYDVLTAMTAAEARELMSQNSPDVIVLDIMLPDGNGLDLMREMRQGRADLPVLLLTGLSTPTDIVRGLSEGGDDYLTKPYDFDVLLARIEALTRRSGRLPETVRRGPLSLDVISCQARLGGEDLMLTQKEFALLLLLIQHEGRALSTEYIYEKVWKQPIGDDKNAVQTAISKLRRKVGHAGLRITSIRSHGYVLDTHIP